MPRAACGAPVMTPNGVNFFSLFSFVLMSQKEGSKVTLLYVARLRFTLFT